MSGHTYGQVDTPIGTLALVANNTHLKAIGFPSETRLPPEVSQPNAILDESARQLAEYFAGARRDFDLPLDPDGTPFQQTVWDALRAIPYGETISYGELARRIGQPSASRAVGAANGRNPIPIVIPCHRVIGGDGKLTGFGGGLPIKQALLDLEGAPPPNSGNGARP